MNVLLIGLSLSAICCLNGIMGKINYLDKASVNLEALPMKKLLEMKKELRKKDHGLQQITTSSVTITGNMPNAMALQRRRDVKGSPTGGSSIQTAFQMSLTVLSFLAFGGYVISLVAQNMRKQQQNEGSTPPQPLKTVVVNQNRRPLRPTVSLGRRKRSRKLT